MCLRFECVVPLVAISAYQCDCDSFFPSSTGRPLCLDRNRMINSRLFSLLSSLFWSVDVYLLSHGLFGMNIVYIPLPPSSSISLLLLPISNPQILLPCDCDVYIFEAIHFLYLSFHLWRSRSSFFYVWTNEPMPPPQHYLRRTLQLFSSCSHRSVKTRCLPYHTVFMLHQIYRWIYILIYLSLTFHHVY